MEYWRKASDEGQMSEQSPWTYPARSIKYLTPGPLRNYMPTMYRPMLAYLLLVIWKTDYNELNCRGIEANWRIVVCHKNLY